MVHVVGVKRGADQLLEHVGFFVGAFGRAEPGNGGGAECLEPGFQARRRHIQGLVPGGLAELAHDIAAVQNVRVFVHALDAD